MLQTRQILAPPPLPTGTDVRTIRGWMNSVQLAVRSCVDAVRAIDYRQTPHTPRDAKMAGPDSDVDSTDFAESIATRTVEGDSALEIAGFFVGTPEDKSLADLLDISEANAKSNYKILVRKHEVGSRPETGFVPIGDLTDGTDLIDTCLLYTSPSPRDS